LRGVGAATLHQRTHSRAPPPARIRRGARAAEPPPPLAPTPSPHLGGDDRAPAEPWPHPRQILVKVIKVSDYRYCAKSAMKRQRTLYTQPKGLLPPNTGESRREKYHRSNAGRAKEVHSLPCPPAPPRARPLPRSTVSPKPPPPISSRAHAPGSSSAGGVEATSRV
jgi:hypothetical protein